MNVRPLDPNGVPLLYVGPYHGDDLVDGGWCLQGDRPHRRYVSVVCSGSRTSPIRIGDVVLRARDPLRGRFLPGITKAL